MPSILKTLKTAVKDTWSNPVELFVLDKLNLVCTLERSRRMGLDPLSESFDDLCAQVLDEPPKKPYGAVEGVFALAKVWDTLCN